MFRLLALTEPSYAVSRKLCRKRRKRGAPVKEVCDIDEEEFYMDLLTGKHIENYFICFCLNLIVLLVIDFVYISQTKDPSQVCDH